MASFKNRLQEFFQKRHLDLPKYETADHGGVFACKIILSDGKAIISDEFPNKKSAEQDAAAKALIYIEKNDDRFPIPQRYISPTIVGMNSPIPVTPTMPKESSPLGEVSYKNLLQEFMQSRSLGTPKYASSPMGPSHSAVWSCELSLPPHPAIANGNHVKFTSSAYFNAKTKAEQDAAKQACQFFKIIPPTESPSPQTVLGTIGGLRREPVPESQGAKALFERGPSAPEFRPSSIPLSSMVSPQPSTIRVSDRPPTTQSSSMYPQPAYSMTPGPKDRLHDEGRLQTRRFLENYMKRYQPSTLEFKVFPKEFFPHGRYYYATVFSSYHKRTFRSQCYHLIPEEAEDDAAEVLLSLMGIIDLPEPRSVAATPEYNRPRTMEDYSTPQKQSFDQTERPPDAEGRATFPGPTVLPSSMSDIESELSALVSNIKKINFPPPVPRPRNNFEVTDEDTDQPLFLEGDT